MDSPDSTPEFVFATKPPPWWKKYAKPSEDFAAFCIRSSQEMVRGAIDIPPEER